MATYTTNLNLKKPDTTDKVSIADINGNMDIIDAQIKANADTTSGKADDSNLIPKVNGIAGQVWTSGGDGTASWADATSGGGSSGGEVWEEVDLANFPTDWEVGDRVKFVYTDKSIKVTVTDWASKFSINGYSTSKYYSQIIEFELRKSYGSVNIPFYMGGTPSKYLDIGYIDTIGGVNYWNYYDRPAFSINHIIFNGNTSESRSRSIYKSDLSTYVSKMWRWRSHSGDTGSGGGGAN